MWRFACGDLPVPVLPVPATAGSCNRWFCWCWVRCLRRFRCWFCWCRVRCLLQFRCRLDARSESFDAYSVRSCHFWLCVFLASSFLVRWAWSFWCGDQTHNLRIFSLKVVRRSSGGFLVHEVFLHLEGYVIFLEDFWCALLLLQKAASIGDCQKVASVGFCMTGGLLLGVMVSPVFSTRGCRAQCM